MLARRYRLTSSSDISAVLKYGQRTRVPYAVVSLWITGGQHCPQVGLVVGKAVGNSVVRSRVSRVLRHAVRPLLTQLPPGAHMVIRALPGAQTDSSAIWTARLARGLKLSMPLAHTDRSDVSEAVDKPVDVLISPGDDSRE